MHILAAYDGSPHSAYAINALRQLPLRKQINLSLVTVARFRPIELWSGITFTNSPAEFVGDERQAIEKSLNEFAETIGNDFNNIETHIPSGSPGAEIVALADAQQAELIVMGAVGLSGIVRVMLGSVSDYVATHARCSTLIVRPPADATVDKAPKSPLPSRVMIAVGHAESDIRLTDWIMRLGLPTETEIELMYVMETYPEHEPNLIRKASLYLSEVRSAAATHMKEMQQQLQAAGYLVNTHIADAAHIGKTLVEQAHKHQCDLIITGDQRESLVEQALLGSTSLFVVRHATCDVLISK